MRPPAARVPALSCRRLAQFLALALGLLAVWDLAHARQVAAGAIAIEAQPVAFDPLDPAETRIGALDYLAGFSLMPAPSLVPTAPSAPFGGFSDMRLVDGGKALLIVSDIGWWWRLALERDGQGRLLGVAAAAAAPLRDERGDALDDKMWADAESMTRLADGRWLVGFERHHRLWAYAGAPDGADLPQGPATPVEAPRAIGDLPENNGIEAMATLPDGRLLLLAEGKDGDVGDGAGWIGRPGHWARLSFARTGLFHPTSLALLPSGDLLLVERSFTPTEGPAVRLSRLRAATLEPGQRLVPEPLAQWRLPLTVDNFEDVAVEPVPAGGCYVFVLSDDNQNPLQRSLLLQFHWQGE